LIYAGKRYIGESNLVQRKANPPRRTKEVVRGEYLPNAMPIPFFSGFPWEDPGGGVGKREPQGARRVPKELPKAQKVGGKRGARRARGSEHNNVRGITR